MKKQVDKMKKLISLLFLISHITTEVTSSSQVSELTDQSFNDYARTRDFLLVDFYAPWCSDSKALAPELEKAAYTLGKRREDVVKVDCFGKGKTLCEIYGIKHWPTLKTFRHGVVNAEYTGSHHAEALLNYINGAEDMLPTTTANNNNVMSFVQTATSTNTKTLPLTVSSSNSTTATVEKPPAAATPSSQQPCSTATVEKTPVAITSSYSDSPSSSVSAEMKEMLNMDVTPEDVVTIGPHGNVHLGEPSASEKMPAAPVSEKTAAVAPQQLTVSVTPTSDVINELECAKCRIMTPIQRSQSTSCRQYRRSCIPNYNQNRNPSMNFAPEQDIDKRHAQSTIPEGRRGRRLRR